MAKIYNIDIDENMFIEMLSRAVQSAHLNFLIGSGCAHPSIPPLGNIENEVSKKMEEGKNQEAQKQIFSFLKPFLDAIEQMKVESKHDAKYIKTLENHKSFLEIISQIIFERKSNIMQKQATVFSTNYDLFIEKAFEGSRSYFRLNDGFIRGPLLLGSFKFSSSEFFNSIYNNGNLYNYQVQVPSINLIKLHGSFNWQTKDDDVVYSVSYLDGLVAEHERLSKKNSDAEIREFNNKFSIILPLIDKFEDTLISQTHYDLLRIYSNELDKENTLLVAEGFSFDDEHIYKITNRALKNPTLKIIIFCYEKSNLSGYQKKFNAFNNVDILFSESEKIDFDKFISIITKILPLINKQQDGKNG